MCIEEMFLSLNYQENYDMGGYKILYLLIRIYESEFPIFSNKRYGVAFEESKKGEKKSRFRLKKREVVGMMSSHFRYIKFEIITG